MQNDIKQLRENNGWTQEYLGFRLRCSRQHVVALENGKHAPSLELAMRIARLFRRPVESVFHPFGGDFSDNDGVCQGDDEFLTASAEPTATFR